ncbi:hypothetical protein [Chenggangzhangella methanolivorans]|uniref:Uncharacterized protein n=1 Tax=Chenggangzhangella methanolivorans TaxID=1437009 RepID=A0A9E6UPN0_9HYPH|nr:hypothetical protein [Chenggangzhangella methanolivorans]QZO02581.1 hypothetical protein K6K41_12065 [Chenggangzhangella methanolivorans]
MHEQIHPTEIDIAEIDGDLFCLAALVANWLNCAHHVSPSAWMSDGCLMDVLQALTNMNVRFDGRGLRASEPLEGNFLRLSIERWSAATLALSNAEGL